MPKYYSINNFRGGVSDENDKGIAGSFKHGEGLDIHGRNDALTAKQALATVDGGLVTDLVQFFVPAQDGTTYCFGSTGSIYARSGDGAWNFAYNDENGKIKGAAEWKLSDGNNYLFWATDSSVARVALNGSLALPWAAGVATQNWKTTLDPAEWHTIKAAAGNLYIANNDYLAEITYAGAFDPAKLNIRPGNLIKTIEERDDYVILGSGRKDENEEGHIWSWLPASTNYIEKKKIPVKGVNAIINTELMLLQGGSDGELFFSDFSSAVPLHAIPEGGQCYPGAVAVEDDLAVFGMFGGTHPGIWSYGRKAKNRSLALNYEYRLAPDIGGSTISTIGAVAVVNGTLLVSWGTTDGSTTDYGVDSVSSTTKTNAIYEGLEFSGGVPHLKKKFNNVKLTFAPLPSGTSLSVKFKTDKQSAWRYAVLGGGSTTYSTANTTEALFSIGDVANVFEVGVEVNSSSNSSPDVLSITTYLGDENYEF